MLFGMAIAGNPELLFLDEPTAGIDSQTRQSFWQGLEELLGECRGTLLFTTHYLEEAERYATRVVVIRQGRVVAEGTPHELRAAANGRTVRFTLPQE
ncbi:ABC transporter ATP-binding protein, partial [mine drainage metagenome]